MFRKIGTMGITLLVAIALLLPGCATLGNSENPNQTALEYFNRYQAIMRLGVQVGVFSVLEPNPTYASRLVAFSEYVQEYLEGEDVIDLQLLDSIVRNKIDWSTYTPAERALIEALITQIGVEIENVLRANKTSIPTPTGEVKMIATSVVGWIGEAANVFIEQQANRAIIPVLPPYDG